MASRKMTFTLPEALAARFLKRVPARERSRYVAEALARRLSQKERRLMRACEVANRSVSVRGVERDFDALKDVIAEPWDVSPTR